ncbi:hypothetical protein [Parageobacillus thermoglucosidasius]|uniref:Uncharacterized protein n=1 Tax=Parageobacillus thermoglucosidasius TaxID=1426 RepID=A0AAN0YLQ9_PARTM|nr:hypothetical protein [Parageobacillus thermoglucosidasius]ALF09305.1 hypothetical protein AOT13_04265 [Parageobacillus thermoglucosidasius]ANZ29387.1 hypothetical protein BCV53_04280 [Parageobacillus thermoglucosidasius]APM80126.1 hypothetical protein BCV54_04285 [Parageobacillus thermoglucosidasius]KJX67754.1 hypothetical protein WH82_16075 [Parageobacillus thermoglucosidasius]RDE20703.1 hypothetical protein DV712_10710 [Parageobacillus thermoglucosidasius]
MKLMFKNISLIFIIIIILFGCISETTNQTIKNRNETGNLDLQDIRTQFLIYEGKLRMYEGGYSIPFIYYGGNIYSTYYIMESLKLLGVNSFTNKRKTIIMLENNLADIEDKNIMMDNLYYTVNILENLGEFKNKKINALLEKMFVKLYRDGYYSFDTYGNEKLKDYLISTYMASQIEDFLQLDKTKIKEDWIANIKLDNSLSNARLIYFKNILLLKFNHNHQIPESDKKIMVKYVNETFSKTKLDLFELNTSLEIIDLLNYYKLDYNKPPDKIFSLLYANQNNDGGWNAALEGPSDEQGTYLALKFLEHFNKDVRKSKILKEMLEDHQGIDGGYSKIIQKEFSIESTNMVKQISDYYGYKTKNEKETKDLLKLIIRKINWDILDGKTIAHIIETLKTYNIKIPEEAIESIQNKYKDLIKNKNYEHALYVSYVMKLINVGIPKLKINIQDNLNNLNFKDHLFLLGTLSISQRISQKDIKIFGKKFQKDIKNNLNDPYIMWILTIISQNGNYVDININDHLNRSIESIKNNKETFHLRDFYYVLKTYQLLNKR